ncbi:MAG: aminoacetone oxidase family FAD-binding enzyme [Firmicutes bacterium]|nr:aminoacetone oxidase family FAD-binding enzyme [Bacillota bacterium]
MPKNNAEKKTVAVIGAGASGLMAALQAAKAGARVIIIDGNEKAGKKIYATGNGRCNFTNRKCDGSADALRAHFNESAAEFAMDTMSSFTADDCIAFFKEQGVLVREESEGRCYPYSGQAQAIVEALTSGCEAAGVEFVLGDRAVDVAGGGAAVGCGLAKDGGFAVVCESGRNILCDRVVIACGGRAGLKFGSTGDGYGFAKKFGHSLVPPKPALVAAESEDWFMSDLKGVRASAVVRLRLDDGVIAEDKGEVQFTGTGVSGICVFDLSRFMDAPRPKKKKKSGKKSDVPEVPEKKYTVVIDLVPEMDVKGLMKLLRGWAVKYCSTDEKGHVYGEISGADLEHMIAGIVNRKLAGVIAALAVEDEVTGEKFTEVNKLIGRSVMMLKGLKVSVASTKGWDDAQTTSGGVRCDEVDSVTMESKLAKGIYLCGEVLDVDGRCGGYNLQWAWASGYAAGTNVAK